MQALLDRDSSTIRVIVVWEHVTPTDRRITLPPTSVLSRIRDPRAAQLWHDDRTLSKRMVADLPPDTLHSVAEIETTGVKVAWDDVALFRPGRRWGDRFPVPDWAGRPVSAVAETLATRLRSLEQAGAADSTR